jgi:hypothetical protein
MKPNAPSSSLGYGGSYNPNFVQNNGQYEGTITYNEYLNEYEQSKLRRVDQCTEEYPCHDTIACKKCRKERSRKAKRLFVSVYNHITAADVALRDARSSARSELANALRLLHFLSLAHDNSIFRSSRRLTQAKSLRSAYLTRIIRIARKRNDPVGRWIVDRMRFLKQLTRERGDLRMRLLWQKFTTEALHRVTGQARYGWRKLRLSTKTEGDYGRAEVLLKKGFGNLWREFLKYEHAGALLAVEVGSDGNVHGHVLYYGPHVNQANLSTFWDKETGCPVVWVGAIYPGRGRKEITAEDARDVVGYYTKWDRKVSLGTRSDYWAQVKGRRLIAKYGSFRGK